MKKRILPLLCLAAVCLALLQPLHVHAAAPLDPDADASLTLRYQKDGIAFPDQEISIFRVAQAFPDGTFALIAPFSFYPVNIHDITEQSQWSTVAATLNAYITAEQVAPDRQETTDAEGIARFTALKTGLYLVREVIAEHAGGRYTFNTFLVYVPTPHPDGTYEYHVEAVPKCTGFLPKTQYTVTKLWQDTGVKEPRPKEITVDIYHDGVLHDTQILNAANDWTYTWHVSGEDTGKWSVAERPVPDGYRVAIYRNDHVFTIVNTHETTPPPPPPTGDSFTPLPWIAGMCLSGIALLLLALFRRRSK